MRSIIQTDTDFCFYPECGKPATEWHHIFGGPRRKWSERDGLVIHCCHECHFKIHNGPESKSRMDALHKLGQEKFEALIGTHDDFMKRYEKNWL